MKKYLKVLMSCVWFGIWCAAFMITRADAEEILNVMVSILPQKYFVEQIGGEYVAVSVMVPAGADPHTYEPKPQQLVHLSRSRIYFAIGIPFESAWLGRFLSVNTDMHVVYTDRGIEKVPARDYHHANEHEVNPEALDPHIWLSPPLVMLQVRTIYSELLKADQIHANTYSERYKALTGQIAHLDSELKKQFHNLGDRNKFIVFHPAWGYFAQAYNLEQIPIEIEGKEPKPGDIMHIISYAREHNINVIFAQPQFSAKSAQTIADAINGEVIYADPLAENWMQNIKNIADAFKTALR